MSHPSQRPAEAREQPRWPVRVLALAAQCRDASAPDPRRQVALGEVWTLVHLGLARYVRQHALHLGPVEPEDVHDIAAEKALDLVRKLETGAWDPSGTEPGQLCAFLSTLARNGLVDHLRSARSSRAYASTAPRGAPPAGTRPHEAPSRALCRILFPQALLDCLAPLSPRAKRIWLLRAFHDLPSKTIARHPDVRTSPAAVDMSLARARIALAHCMRRKGFDLPELPTGTFTAVWAFLASRRRPGMRP